MSRIFLAALVMAVSLAAKAGVQIQHWVAPSGARVYFVESHDLPILDIDASFAAGGVYAPAGKTGLAGLTQGLLDGGAGNLDEEAISARLSDIGARMGGSVDDDRAAVTLRTLSYLKEREAALDLMRLVMRKTGTALGEI